MSDKALCPHCAEPYSLRHVIFHDDHKGHCSRCGGNLASFDKPRTMTFTAIPGVLEGLGPLQKALIGGSVGKDSKLADNLGRHLHELSLSRDDRTTSIVGALCVENAVDVLLEAFMPSYVTRRRRDLLFEMKVGILEGLRFVPTQLLQDVRVIKDIRNQFAHEIDIFAFGELPSKLQSELKRCTEAWKPSAFAANAIREVFSVLVQRTTAALVIIATNVGELRSFLESPDFEAAFGSFQQRIHGIKSTEPQEE